MISTGLISAGIVGLPFSVFSMYFSLSLSFVLGFLSRPPARVVLSVNTTIFQGIDERGTLAPNCTIDLASSDSLAGMKGDNDRLGQLRVSALAARTLVHRFTCRVLWHSHCHYSSQGAFWFHSWVQHDRSLQQHDCVRWCHHLCLMRSCRRVDGWPQFRSLRWFWWRSSLISPGTGFNSVLRSRLSTPALSPTEVYTVSPRTEFKQRLRSRSSTPAISPTEVYTVFSVDTTAFAVQIFATPFLSPNEVITHFSQDKVLQRFHPQSELYALSRCQVPRSLSHLQQQDCVRWCHLLFLALSCRHVGRLCTFTAASISTPFLGCL